MERIERAVEAVERGSSVEVVVRVVPCASRYRVVGMGLALGFALVGLALVLFTSVVVTEAWVLPNVLAAALLGALLGKIPAVVRWLLPRRLRRARVREATQASFVTQSVDATRERTGVHLFVSVLEREIGLYADYGVQGAIPPAEWGLLEKLARDDKSALPDRLMALLAALEPLAAQHLPAGEENPNELSNRPIIG